MKEAFDELVRRVDFFHDVIDFRGILECVSYAPKTRVGVGDFLRDGFHSNSREDLIDTLGGLSASRSHERDDDRWSLAYERATVVGSTHYVRELRSFRSVDLEEGLKAPFPRDGFGHGFPLKSRPFPPGDILGEGALDDRDELGDLQLQGLEVLGGPPLTHVAV